MLSVSGQIPADNNTVPLWCRVLVNPEQAEALTGISREVYRMMYHLTAIGELDLPCARKGNEVLIHLPMLNKWLADKMDGHMDFKIATIKKWLKEAKERDAAQHKPGRRRKIRC